MKLCTFTGVDNTTSLLDLSILSAHHPFIEWGVLVSYTQTAARYPSLDVLTRVNELAAKKPRMNFAFHLCGRAALDFIEQKEFLYPHIKRVQLNILAGKIDSAKIKAAIEHYPHIEFITQHNSQNQHLVEDLRDVANHSILFDSSGGRGVSPTQWPQSISGKFCGYAGGLGTDNVAEQILDIERQTTHGNNQHNYWIDMEQKLRTNDKFDLQICKAVAEFVRPYAK